MSRFKELYLKHTKEELDDAQALDLATRFLHLTYFAMTKPPEPSAERKAEIEREREFRVRKTEKDRRAGRIGIRPAPEQVP